MATDLHLGPVGYPDLRRCLLRLRHGNLPRQASRVRSEPEAVCGRHQEWIGSRSDLLRSRQEAPCPASISTATASGSR